jgi:hypothetical protein
MTDDIVARLRALVIMDEVGSDNPLGRDAADEIERLVRSRNKWGKLYNQTLEKLRLSVLSDSEYVKIIDEKCVEQSDRIEKLEAALRFYACDCKPECKCGLEYYSGVTYCGHTARKALEGKDV